jgi:hypothetical protein
MTTPTTTGATAVTTTAALSLSLVAAESIPARATGTASEKLLVYQAAAKAARVLLAAPLVEGLLSGQALTDNITYVSQAEATKVSANAKRLVTPGLAADGFRPAVRVTGSATAWAWHLIAVAKPASKAVTS